MEALLSLAFDNLSSYDGPKVRKGLRQVEGLLAQICLSRRASDDDDDDRPESPTPHPGKSLAELSEDLAFREFFKLQEGFEWNVAMRLVGALDRLMGRGYGDGQNDLLILAALDSIQGVLLLHPPSKVLFSREQNMNVSLPLLFPSHHDKALTNDRAAAPPRPPRARQLPRHPVRHPPHPRNSPHRHPAQHARLRGPRRPPGRHLALQVALHHPRG